MQTAGTSSRIKNLNFVCAEHLRTNHTRALCKRTVPKTREGGTEVFARFCYSSKKAIQGSILIWAIISFTCTLLLPYQKPNVMPAAKQPCVWTQKHNLVLLPWKVLGPHGQSWASSAVWDTCCAQEEAEPISAQSISLSFPLTALITREYIFHCDTMKRIDFQSFTRGLKSLFH